MSINAADLRGRPGFGWVAPAGVFFSIFGVIPILMVIYLSFTKWNGIGSPQWIGGANWTHLTTDPNLVESIKNSIYLTIGTWFVQTPLSMLLGVWAAGPQRFRAILSTIFFLPLLLSTAAIALVFVCLLDPNFGLAGSLGKYVGVPDGNFLGDPHRALITVILVIAWQFVPFHTLLYQAATRQIPGELLEAAAIDGAGTVRQFFSIIIPQLRNTIIGSSVLMLVGSVTAFETVLLLTDGGPGTSTRVLPLQMYDQGFDAFNMGYASALAVLLVVVGTVLSIIVVRVSGYHRMASQREGL